ncbi:MAG: O-antigen ligase family protein [Planctomycetaceae bacterium]
MRLATAMTAMAIVYVAYWPCDSTEVQQGAARYLVAWLMTAAAIAVASFGPVQHSDALIDGCAVGLAAWMGFSLVALADEANLRLGINELGWWFATAGLVITARRVASDARASLTLMQLIIAASIGVAVYGWHQWLIGFPRMVAEYQANPDATLAKLGIDAAPGSAMRIIFENRLYDGGPTGTFALANSMAAMLVGGWVALIGWLVASWGSLRKVHRAIGIAGLMVVGGMLLAARSRTAVLAIVLLAVWIAFSQLAERHSLRAALRRRARTWLLAMAGLGSTLLVGGYLLRDTEWVRQAPASLAIRLHYWWACLQMVAQSPLFGAGPGQFKARYENFRAATSTEQISDPHQFLLQTLSSGGIPSFVLLVALLGLLIWSGRRSASRANANGGCDAESGTVDAGRRHTGVAGGALIGLAGVWLLGMAMGLMPEIEAALAGTIVAAGFALWMSTSRGAAGWSHVNSGSQVEDPPAAITVRSIAGLAAAAMGIDLLASGGMTVPGVSVIAWTWIAIAAPAQVQWPQVDVDTKLASDAPPIAGRVAGAGLIGVVLVAWYWLGITPIEKAKAQRNRFEVAWSQGQGELATQSLQRAAQADRWDPQPLIQLAAVCRSLAIAQPEHRQPWQEMWSAAETQAAERAGKNPVVMRQLGDNWLVHFQRYGEAEALVAAERWYAQAAELSPSHEAYAAQWAEILRERGDSRAPQIARQALELSTAGGYYERALAFTMIMPAKHFGTLASNQPVQQPAAEVLAPLLAVRP